MKSDSTGITAGGNIIKYPGGLTTRTADLTTSKILWNSVLITQDAKYMCIDIKNFYFGTPLDIFEYMQIPLTMFPDHVAQQYQLWGKEKNGFIYVKIRNAIYGLPQAGVLRLDWASMSKTCWAQYMVLPPWILDLRPDLGFLILGYKTALKLYFHTNCFFFSDKC